jgi:hypothetical protein
MNIVPKVIFMFNAIPIKIPMTFITEIEKSTLKFIWKHKRLQIVKAILSKKSNAGGITIPDLKLYYKVIAIKTAWYWHKNRYEDQWNRTEEPDMNPYNYTYLMLVKVVIHLQKTQTRSMISPTISVNSKWVKDLNIRLKTLKLVQERVGTLWN